MPAPQRRLRVALDAHTVGRPQTGNETYVIQLAAALAARDDVEPIAYLEQGARWPPGFPPLRTRRLRLRAPQLRIPIELPFRARADRVDVLHVQYVAPLTRKPVVTAVHDLSFEDLEDAFSTRSRLRLKATVPWSARRSGAVVTLSEFTRSRLLHHYDLAPDRVFVAPGGVSSGWRALPDEEVARRLSGVGLPARFVLAVGNLHPRKNIPRLIRALDRLRRRGLDDVALVLAGQRGWRAEDVDATVAAVGGESWVHRLGYVPDLTLEALYNRARVVAYPSLYEGFGLPVAEALAIGAVVVAADATSIPEVAAGAAVLVDPTDDDAVAAGLIVALTDEALRERLRAAGPARARQLSWAVCAARTMEAYRRAIA